ncbi:DUF1236 domain-containing protein [Falsochrobactrum sp. TDYN1]|uniref:DUF1236 domain-containing protein n=1 Tax=Falsochrobactrum tianjinense TaxID=2706015 RepID=A0A949PNH4_9HYPH|nr:DUF1236 domain-containing protein [Falsochrobactrum sp. TDYN1]MBV2143575.1 DUF1236 domain-containing protein [Falsochrobactrum sp. TDYN1]
MRKIILVAATALLAAPSAAFAQDTVIVEVPSRVQEYVLTHPADPVVIEDEIGQGYILPEAVIVNPIPDDPDFGYIYVDGKPVIVSMQNRTVVYYTEAPSAGPVIPDDVVTYIEDNPLPPVVYEGDLAEGTIIPSDIPLEIVPDQPTYSYIYVNGRPALVETDTRRIVWVR